MNNPGIELVQIPIEPPQPELYIPTFNAINEYGPDGVSQDFYKASSAVIATLVQMIPVVDEEHPYHNRLHTVDVIEGYLEIATPALDDGSITPREMLLGLIACAGHDIEYDKEDKPKNKEEAHKAGTNENRSKTIVRTVMDEHDAFSEDDKDIVSECIEATIFEGIGERGEILQRSSALEIARYVVDADLYNLAMTPLRAIERFARFFYEDKGKIFPLRPDAAKLPLEFIKFEITTLSAHVYKTRHAKTKWGGSERGIRANIAYLQQLHEKMS